MYLGGLEGDIMQGGGNYIITTKGPVTELPGDIKQHPVNFKFPIFTYKPPHHSGRETQPQETI